MGELGYVAGKHKWKGGGGGRGLTAGILSGLRRTGLRVYIKQRRERYGSGTPASDTGVILTQ